MTYVLAAMSASLLAGFTFIAAVDLYLHAKYERTGSLNRWGYRGPVVPPRQPGELRIAVLGGSTAFGYGPDWDGAFPYLLEQRLNQRNALDGRRAVVINLAYNNEGAYAFRFTMEDYEYLGFDLVILYEGYNDLGDEPNYRVFRRDSGIFRATGYLPIAPMILREKAATFLYGSVSAAYEGRTTFRSSLAERATGEALQVAAATVEALERQLGRLTRDLRDPALVTPNAGCGDRWKHYCGAVHDAIRWARDRHLGVIVGTQPYISDRHVDQQNALIAMLEREFGDDPGVVHVNLGRAVDLRDSALAYDGMHLTVEGNAIIAEGFVEPVRALASTVASQSSVH